MTEVRFHQHGRSTDEPHVARWPAAPPPGRAPWPGSGSEARRHRPRVHQHPGRGVSPDPSGPAGDVPDQGAERPEGRLRVLRQPAVSREEGRGWLLDRDHGTPGAGVPLLPGVHRRAEGRDSAEVNDPGSHTFYGTGKDASGIEIPEKGVDFYLPKDVPHGEVRERWYFSKTTQDWRRAFVYTPPGYDNDRDDAISGPVPPARRRRGRDGLAASRGTSPSSWTT